MSKAITGRTLFPEGVQWAERSSPATRPSAWDDYWYGNQGYSSKTGIDVTEDLALTYAAVWACVRVISEDIASLPLHVYRRVDKIKERAPDHPLYPLLHDQPNDEMTAMQFREAMQAHLLLWGNCYAMIQCNLRGEPMALWPLHPGRMEVERDKSEQLIYKYTKVGAGEPDYFSKDEILHIAGLGFNGLIGYSIIKYQCEAIGLGLSNQELQSSSNKSGSRLQLWFTHPAVKAPNKEGREQFVADLRKEYGGNTGNAIGVGWEGMKAEKISQTMQEAQLAERLQMNIADICRIFRVPPHKIMDLLRSTNNNIEHQGIEYVVDCIRPWAVRWEQQINMKLLGGSREYYVEHSLDGLMRGDILSRYQAYNIAIISKILNPNECRGYENLNPYEGGDVYANPNIDKASLPDKSVDEPITDDEKERAALAIRQIRLIKGA
jgi:HK97 family phage portal protein